MYIIPGKITLADKANFSFGLFWQFYVVLAALRRFCPLNDGAATNCQDDDFFSYDIHMYIL